MTEVYIGKTARTAMGKRNGLFRKTDAVRMTAEIMKYLAVEPDEFIFGATQQYGQQGYNFTRQAALAAGFNSAIPALTVNRLCGSSMSAVHTAFANVRAGLGSTYVVGGTEHMTGNPMTEHYYDQPGSISLAVAKGSAMMGLTAEMVANLNTVSRKAQDEFALLSQIRAAENMEKDINIFITGHKEDGNLVIARRDEGIRDTSAESLAGLKPSFDPKGTVTAGNSSGIADGSAGAVITSEREGARARIVSVASTAGDAATMGLQPINAIRKVLNTAGITIAAVDAFEINEAFAAQAVPVVETLGIDADKVNSWGGAIAIGHPHGCSGARIIHTLLNRMEESDQTIGVAAMCIGMGQGIATVIERV